MATTHHQSFLFLLLFFTIPTPLFASPPPPLPQPNATASPLPLPPHLQPSPQLLHPKFTNTLPPPSTPPMISSTFPPSSRSGTTDPQPSSTLQQQQLNNIIDALLGAGDFSTWSNFLSAADSSALPLSATLFIPADDSFPQPPPNSVTVDPFVFPYHLVPQRLVFSDLCLLPPLSRLPTLLPAKTILITNTSLTNFTLDDTLLSHPDLYTTAAVAVHGITTLFDYKKYGDSGGPVTSIRKPSTEEVTASPPPPPQNIPGTFSPPGMFLPGGEFVGGRKSEAACLCLEFPVVFSVVCGVLAFKIHR